MKKMNTVYGPHTLREAFDLTLEFEKEVPDYAAWP